MTTTLDLEGSGFRADGAHLLVKRALAALPAGRAVEVTGRAPALAVHLRAWCRGHGHGIDWPGRLVAELGGAVVAVVVRGDADDSGGRRRAGGRA